MQLVLLIMAVAFLCGLGIWQIRRGQEKAALLQAYAAAGTATPRAITRQWIPSPSDAWTAVSVTGHYRADRQLLLDDQSRGEVAGRDVWTPFELDDGGLILVDRGWIAHDARPDEVPAGTTTITGLWRELPQPGYRFSADNCASGGYPKIVSYPRQSDLVCLFGASVLPGVVLLAPNQPNGYLREWKPVTTFPPERHYGYALTWFGLALTLLILTLKSIFRKNRKNP